MKRLLPVLLLIASPAFAAQWDVDQAASSLTFTGAQAGTPFTGSFEQFTPAIDFDPAHPELGKISATINMASAKIPEDKEQNDSLPSEDWFFTKQFPQATFQSTAIHKTATGFAADGTLTIRGVSKPITLPFTLTEAGGATRADGELTLNRRDFGLGGKQWADDKWVAYPVKIRYIITATQKK